MTDREKMIQALEHCMKDEGCKGCPYDGECARRLFAVDSDVIELLRRQEPVNVRPNFGGIWRCSCGECGKPLYERDFKYCPFCGRGIKWNEDY